MAQETVNTQSPRASNWRSSNPWPKMLNLEEPGNSSDTDLSEYPRLAPLIKTYMDPETPEPLRESIKFALDSGCGVGLIGLFDTGQMLAHHFDHTNTPPPAWFLSRVQEAEQEATGAIREAQHELHAALRDRALVRLPWQCEVSELESDIGRAVKQVNLCASRP